MRLKNFNIDEYTAEDTELKRDLGTKEAVSIVVNRIIGSGIFRTPGPIMLAVGSVSLFYGVWLLGAVATILGALCYAEMVAMMPRSGGPYVFLRAAYPPIVTFLRGWAMFFVSETGAIAAVSVFFAEIFFPLTGLEPTKLLTAGFAIAIIWGLTYLNMLGVKLGGQIQNLFSFLKIGSLVAVIVISFSAHNGFPGMEGHVFPAEFGWSSLLAMGAALRYGFFAYSGWEGATYVAEEVKNPRKTLPLSLFLGIGGILLIYIAANTAYLAVLSPAEMANSKIAAVDALNTAIGVMGGTFIAAAIGLNTFGNVNTQIMVKARTWFSMARDGMFFKQFAQVHPKFKTPANALAGQAIWATVLVVFAVAATNAYETLIDFFSFTSTIFNILTFAAVYVLRRKYPQVKRSYKAWGYPYILIVVLAIQLWFMVTTLISAFWPSMVGLALTATGLVYYYRVVR